MLAKTSLKPTAPPARPPWSTLVAACLAAALVAGCSAGTAPAPVPPDAGLAGVVMIPGLSHEHREQDQAYPQTPPAGGPHWPPPTREGYGWLRCGVYGEPVVDEFAVHSLEHGAVWLTYRPGADPDAISELAGLAGVNPAYVLVSPVPGQSAPFMATAWGLQLGVEAAADPRLRGFVQTYAGGAQGGEPGADCANGSEPPAARAALARVAAG